MKTKYLVPVCFLILHSSLCLSLRAQSTAFTYQGRLEDGGTAAHGSYDLAFALYDASGGGTQQGPALTNAATAVSNGLFTVTLDFGNQFPGADRWLDLGVRTNGGGAFSTLTPRQAITATPYAVQAATAATASSVAAANITGTIPIARLPSTIVTNGASGVNISGSFSGSGAGLSNVNISLLQSGGAISWPGSFSVTSTVTTGDQPRDLAIADLDGDGFPEIIVADGLAGLSIFKRLNSNEYGLVTNLVSPGLLTFFLGVVAADFNGDGATDLAAPESTNLGRFLVFTNNGIGLMGRSVSSNLAVPEFPRGIAAADMNNDGAIDLVMTHSASSPIVNSVSVLTNSGAGMFFLQTNLVVGTNILTERVTLGDINADGWVDIVTANRGDFSCSIITNRLGLGYSLVAKVLGATELQCHLVDMDGNGSLDLVGGGGGPIRTNNGFGNFSSTGVNPTLASATAVADMNHDGRADLIGFQSSGTNVVAVVLTNAGGLIFGLSSSTIVPSGGPYIAVATSDLNLDLNIDIVAVDLLESTMSVLHSDLLFKGRFSGDGQALQNLSAAAIGSGILSDARLSTNVSRLGQTIESFEITDGTIVNADISASAAITDTKLATISSAGKVADTALSTNVALRNTPQTFSSNLSAGGNVSVGAFPVIAQSSIAPVANVTLSPTTGYVVLTPTNNITLNATTAIATGSGIAGRVLILQGNGGFTVTVPDSANTRLNGAIILGNNDVLTLIWNGADWAQISFSDN